jgi:hypothetical protein
MIAAFSCGRSSAGIQGPASIARPATLAARGRPSIGDIIVDLVLSWLRKRVAGSALSADQLARLEAWLGPLGGG